MWNNKFKDEFKNLEIALMPITQDESHKTVLSKVVGEMTQELDVSYAIGREEDGDIEVLRQRM